MTRRRSKTIPAGPHTVIFQLNERGIKMMLKQMEARGLYTGWDGESLYIPGRLVGELMRELLREGFDKYVRGLIWIETKEGVKTTTKQELGSLIEETRGLLKEIENAMVPPVTSTSNCTCGRQ